MTTNPNLSGLGYTCSSDYMNNNFISDLKHQHYDHDSFFPQCTTHYRVPRSLFALSDFESYNRWTPEE